MSINKTNIAQIQKYLKGELDAKAMHALEKQAQNDPFLMDALEGYQAAGGDQQKNLEDIKVRLDKRVQGTERRSVLLWRVLPIAASLLIALTVGLLWLKQKSPEKAPLATAAKTIPTEKKKEDKQVVLAQQSKPYVPPPRQYSQPKKLTERALADNASPAKQPGLALEGKVYVRPDRQSKKLIDSALAYIAPSVKAQEDVVVIGYGRVKAKEKSGAMLNNVTIRGRVAGVSAADTVDYKSSGYAVAKTELYKKKTAPADNDKKITGVVTDPTGHSLSRVSVAIKGKHISAVTDSNGVFTIAATSLKDTLTVVSLGYERKQIQLNGDKVKVVLTEKANALAEVSVTAHVSDEKSGPQSQSVSSWKSFRDYIRKHAFMPDGTTGKVKLTFTVLADGSINAISVIRGKNAALNQKAIDLVMNGPAWKGDGDRVMKLNIKFRKPS